MELEEVCDADDLQSLKAKYNKLKRETEELERDFGQKRAKFKQLYLDCEANLQAEKEANKKTGATIKELEKQIDDLKLENAGIRTAAQLSEEAVREEIQALKLKHQEEIASLQHIWQEGAKEAQISIARNFEEERNALRKQNQFLEQQVKERHSKHEDTKERGGSGEGIMYMMTQAIRRNTSSPSPSKEGKEGKEGKEEQQAESLEQSMKKAQENAEAWRSIVMPLEQQISSLRSKLKEANEKIRAYESKQGAHESETHSTKQTSSEGLEEKAKELQNYLDAERSSRTDLEMFVAVLNTQKGVLQEDADKLRRELHNVCRLLEQEKMAHRELKQTWKMANDQFLEQQTLLLREIELMRRIMSPAQLEKLSKEMRHFKAQVVKTIAEEPYTIGKRSTDDLITFDDSPKKSAKTLSTESNENPSKEQIINEPDGSQRPTESTQRGRHPSESARSLEEGEELQEEEDTRQSTSTHGGLFKSSSSSNIHELSDGFSTPVKSLSHGDLTGNTRETPVSISSSWVELPTPAARDIEEKLHLNETGWSTMKESHSVSQFCMMCQNYEKQLQRLQSDFTQLQARNDSLHLALKREKETNSQERDKVNSLEQNLQLISDEIRTKLETCSKDQFDTQNELVQIQQEFASAQQDMLSRLQEVSEDRDRILAQMESLQEEAAYRSSVGQFGRDGSDPTTMATPHDETVEMSVKLQALQSAAERREEELRSEIMFLRDRVTAEQFDRENMERLLQQELDGAREEIALLRHDLNSKTALAAEDGGS